MQTAAPAAGCFVALPHSLLVGDEIIEAQVVAVLTTVDLVERQGKD